MNTWTADELERISRSEEVDIAPNRLDGTPGRPTTVWVVRVGDDLYVRSYRGPAGRWYHHANASGHGTVTASHTDYQVTFEAAPDADSAAIDTAYRTKYARYTDSYVKAMVSPDAQATTLRLQPR